MAPSKKLSKATKLKGLYRRRSNIVNSAELIQTFDNEYVPDQANQLVVRIQHLDELWRDFQAIQDQIEDLDEPEEEFCEDRRVFQNQYYALKASLTSKVPPSPTLLPPIAVRNPPTPQLVPNLHLPEIKLKEFAGNFDEWESFSDLFVSLIDSNQQLTMEQKLYYLRASITGEAARMISSLDLTANNYRVAWNLLKNWFENKHMLIKRHMAGLLLISPLKKESASGLLDVADVFDRHVQCLDKLEDAEDHWNSFLVERLSSYLDPSSIREWETQSAGEIKPTYKQITDFIHKRSRILQTLTLSQPCTSSQAESKLVPRVFSAHASTSGTGMCVCCEQQHLLFQCEKFQLLSPLKRFNVVKKNGLCINCLKIGHLANDCPSGTCKTCSKKHHSMLHFPPPTSTINRLLQPVPQSSFAESNWSQNHHTQLGSVQSSRSVELLEASPPMSSFREVSSAFGYESPSSSVVSSVSNLLPPAGQRLEVLHQQNPNRVLLSTAVIKVLDAENKYQYARALLDSGSQPSFISEAFCQRLNLNRTKLNFPVSGIGQSMVDARYGVTMSIASRLGNFTSSLDCLVLPKLTVALPSCNIDVARWRIPRHLPLADPQFNVSQGVDVIIGAELFYSLLENQQIKLDVGYPILQKTVLGFVVSGKVPEQAAMDVIVQSRHLETLESLSATERKETVGKDERIDARKSSSEGRKYRIRRGRSRAQRCAQGVPSAVQWR